MAFPDPPSLLDEWGLLFQTGSLNASFSEASEPEQGIIDWPFEEEVSMSTVGQLNAKKLDTANNRPVHNRAAVQSQETRGVSNDQEQHARAC